MKVLSLATLFLLLSTSFCSALNVKLTFRNLLLKVNRTALEEIFVALFTYHSIHSNLLLRLAAYDCFDFVDFMPSNPSVIEPFVKLLRQQKKTPKEILEIQFYDFDKLQRSKVGRRFLIKYEVSFARIEWNPFLFTPKQVKLILSKIQKLLPSQIEHLDTNALLRLLNNNESSFFGRDGHWNLFPISSFIYDYGYYYSPIDFKALLLWLNQISPQIEHDELLFYRLAFLSWYFQIIEPKFTSLARELLIEVLITKKSSINDFRKSVFTHYSQQANANLKPFLEIPKHILAKDPIARATLHFEHIIGAFEMGYRVPRDIIIKLFQTFNPSLVSPFICRSLLWYLKYHDVLLVMEAVPDWKKVYYGTRLAYSYFPKRFLPAKVQFRLWQRSKFRIENLPTLNQPKLFLNHPQSWRRYAVKEKGIAIEKQGFTYINCQAGQKSIHKFIKRRIIVFLLFGVPLPKITAIVQKYDFVDDDTKLSSVAKEDFVDSLCIRKDNQRSTYEEAKNLLDEIQRIFAREEVPQLFFATLLSKTLDEGIFPATEYSKEKILHDK